MKQHITGDVVANAVRMKRTIHSGAFLILEGSSDAALFRKFIDHENCRVEIAWGRHNAVAAIAILNIDQFEGALAIVDADFAHLTGTAQIKNVICTDDHDLECLMLKSVALDRVLEEYGIEDRVKAFSNRHGPLIGYAVASNAALLGSLLFISLSNDYGLDFEGLKFSRFINPDSLQIEIDAMLKDVADNSSKHALDWPSIKAEVILMNSAGHDPWHLACGHHIVEILAIGFRRTFASHTKGETSPEALHRALRLAFSWSEFVVTSLYKRIRDWEKENPRFQIMLAAG